MIGKTFALVFQAINAAPVYIFINPPVFDILPSGNNTTGLPSRTTLMIVRKL